MPTSVLRPCLHGDYHRPGQCPEANVLAIVPVVVPVVAIIPADVEAVDVFLHGDTAESVDVGPFGGTYLRLVAPDLVVAVADARRLLDLIETAVLDARQEQADAERQQCPWCPTLIDPDDEYCGSAVCARKADQERLAGAWT